MAGLFGKVARFAASPQGRRLIEKGKDAAADPRNRVRIEQAASRLRRRGGRPPA